MRLHHTHSVFTKLGRGLTWNLVLIVVAVRQMRLATVLLITIVLMVMVELSETRRRGGSSRGSRSSRSRSSSGGSSSNLKSPRTHQSKPPQFALRWLSNKLNWVRVQARSRELEGRNRRPLGWLDNCSEIQKWRNENTTRSRQNSVVGRHQGSRLWSCKSRQLQLDYCDGNNLYTSREHCPRYDGYHVRDKSERLKQTEHQQNASLSRYYVVCVYESTWISLLNQEGSCFASINMFSYYDSS